MIFLVCWSASALAEDVYEEWVARWNGLENAQNVPAAIATDGNGNVYVVGQSWSGSNYDDYVTIKYSPKGDTLWLRRYDRAADWPSDLVVDKSGDVIITGSSIGEGMVYATLKYNSDGDTLWVATYQGGGALASALAVDTSGNVYVTGTSMWAGSIATIKYYSNGGTAWTRHYTGAGGLEAVDVAVDDDGNILVIGNTEYFSTSSDFITIKYNQNGDSLWAHKFDGAAKGLDHAAALDVDHLGNVYVTGTSWTGFGTHLDFATIKYSADGESLWTALYNGPGNGLDYGLAIRATGAGGAYATGSSMSDSTIDYITFKCDSNGDTVWMRRYKGIENFGNFANGLELDTGGNIYISGRRWGGDEALYDIVTVKYTPDGDALWAKSYDGISFSDDQLVGMTVDSEANIYLLGSTYNEESQTDFTTIKYSPCTSSSPKAGDANSDDSLSILDVISTFYYIFGKAPRLSPPCDSNLFDCRVYDRICRYDWNGDGQVRLTDCIWAINYVFNKPGGPWNPVASLGCCPFSQIR